jgi:outer membrane protein assembly factor BamB
MFPRPRGRRGWAALGAVVLALAAALTVALAHSSRPGDVYDPRVEFRAPTTATTEQPTRTLAPTDHPMDDGFSWPTFGDTPQRTHALAVGTALRPPFVEQWKVGSKVLIEFPPVICGKALYLQKNNAAITKLSRLSGRARWKTKVGELAASSPACGGDSVYAVVLKRGRGIRAGRVVSLATRNGRVRWSRRLPSRSESSPLLWRGTLYFGSEDGNVYALRARDGSLRWRYRARGAVKGAVSLDQGRLYFGDYSGQVTALRASDGHRLWRASGAGGAALGVGGGARFYSSPAVAYGRVYIGSLDGFVYSFSAANGRLAWRHRTGGYVYSSPAVAAPPGLGPTVYIGSYDGRLYALNARTGAARWTRRSGGKLSGTPSVIGDLVFYSNLTRRSTAAVGAATGRLVWATGDGAFNPVISDGRRLYFVAYSSLALLSSPRQARSDVRSRERLVRRAGVKTRARERAAAQARRERAAARRRAAIRRVIARRAAIRRNKRLRRAGREVCFGRDGRRVCRVPRPLVCLKRSSDGRTICRPRKP